MKTINMVLTQTTDHVHVVRIHYLLEFILKKHKKTKKKQCFMSNYEDFPEVKLI